MLLTSQRRQSKNVPRGLKSHANATPPTASNGWYPRAVRDPVAKYAPSHNAVVHQSPMRLLAGYRHPCPQGWLSRPVNTRFWELNARGKSCTPAAPTKSHSVARSAVKPSDDSGIWASVVPVRKKNKKPAGMESSRCVVFTKHCFVLNVTTKMANNQVVGFLANEAAISKLFLTTRLFPS